MDECTFKFDSFEININEPFQIWNNFVLYQLIGDLNINLNKDILLFTEVNNLNINVIYQIIICDFEGYDYSITDLNDYTDFWLFVSIQYLTQSIYLINSEWFDIDEYIISNQIIIDNRNYTFCNSIIQNSTSDGIIDIIIPCFEEDNIPTMTPTNALFTNSPTTEPTFEPS